MSAQEAAAALADVEQAGHRVQRLRGYREASPYLILWGVVWVLANLGTWLWPVLGGRIWTIGSLAGSAGTALLVMMQSRRMCSSGELSAAQRARRRRTAMMVGSALLAFFPATMLVLSPLNGHQANTFISLFWAFAYMVGGAWLGTRLYLTGLATAAAVVVGYLWFADYYYLWMAIAGGGSLLLGGLWLRRV